MDSQLASHGETKSSLMPLTNPEVFVILYFRGMGLSNSAVEEILRLKIHPLSSVAQGSVSLRVTEICVKEQKEGYPALRRSSGEWNRSALNDFLKRTASGLSDDEQRKLTQIDDAEQEIIDRVRTKYSSWCCVANEMIKHANTKGSKRPRAREHNASRHGPGHRQSSKASAFPPIYTTGFTPIDQHQPHDMTHAFDIHSPRKPRHGLRLSRSDHYQTNDNSTATNFQSPYGPSGDNDGRLTGNRPAYNSAPYSGGRTNTGPPFQSLDYSYVAPTPHSDYHAGRSNRERERRSTRPTETSGYRSITPRPKGPRAPDGRYDIYF